VGSQSRYGRDRPVGDREAAEAHEYCAVAELLDDYRDEIIGNRAVAMQVRNVLRSAAIELRQDEHFPSRFVGLPKGSPTRSVAPGTLQGRGIQETALCGPLPPESVTDPVQIATTSAPRPTRHGRAHRA
jgi:hypothetical protein